MDVLCDVIVGDSLKQKLDNLSDTVTDNVRGTGTERSIREFYLGLFEDFTYLGLRITVAFYECIFILSFCCVNFTMLVVVRSTYNVFYSF